MSIENQPSAAGLRLVMCVLSLGALTQPAAAYLESDTGTMLLQLGFGIVAGGIVAGYLYRKQIAGLFRRSKRDDQ